MGSKRKLAKILNDTLEFSEDFPDNRDTVITGQSNGETSQNGIRDISRKMQQDNSAVTLRQSFALGLANSFVHHFPDLALGNGKYVSASFHLVPGKTLFNFRVGKNTEENPSLVRLTEEGLDKMLSLAPIYLNYIEQWDKLKKASEEEENFNLSEKKLPEIPPAVLIDEGGLYPVELGVFKYKDTLGVGIALRSLKGRNDFPNDISSQEVGGSSYNRRGAMKPFGMTGLNFKNFLKVHVPFFQSSYTEVKNMLENIIHKEGGAPKEGSKITSWRNV